MCHNSVDGIQLDLSFSGVIPSGVSSVKIQLLFQSFPLPMFSDNMFLARRLASVLQFSRKECTFLEVNRKDIGSLMVIKAVTFPVCLLLVTFAI